jgi:hypothetical protein
LIQIRDAALDLAEVSRRPTAAGFAVSFACPSFIGDRYPELCLPVDHYCERASAAFDAEPINALTNAAFLVAGWAAWRLYRQHRDGAAARGIAALIVIMVIVGLGSFLFHTVATRWAEWGDVVPILAFMLVYLWLALSIFFAWPAWLELPSVLLYFAITFYIEAAVPAAVLWGGALYVPTLVLMIAICAALYAMRDAAAKPIALATGAFLLSLLFRSLDHRVCAAFPIGTHFVWHLLNATVLYLLTRALILSDQRPALAPAR